MTNRTVRSGVINRNQILLLLYAIIVACMISGYKGVANYIAFGAMLALLLVWFISRGWKVGVTRELLFAVWFMLYYVVTSMFDLDVDYFATYTAYNLLLLLPIFMCLIVEKNQDYRFMRSCLKTTLVLWFAMCVYTIGYYLTNPAAARLSAANQEAYTGIIIGGYQFAYGSSLLGVYLFSLLFDKRVSGRGKKWLLILGVALSALAVYLTESTLTTFSLIIGIVFALLFDRNREREKLARNRILPVILLVIAIIGGYFLLAANADPINVWLKQRSDVLFYKRLSEVVDAVFYDTESGHYTKRIDVIVRSWNTFLSSPIFGIGYQYGNVFSEGKLSGIGNHSEVVDTLARYGIVGTIPVFGLYLAAFKRFSGSYIGVMVTFLFMMFCNPSRAFGLHLILLLVIPIAESLLVKKQR